MTFHMLQVRRCMQMNGAAGQVRGTRQYWGAVMIYPLGVAATAPQCLPSSARVCGLPAPAPMPQPAPPCPSLLRRRPPTPAPNPQAVRYRSAYDCLRQLLRSPGGGLAALYRGCAANCLKTSIGAPIHFIMYDAIKAGIQAVDPTTGVSSPL